MCPAAAAGAQAAASPWTKPSLKPLSAQEPPALPTERSRRGKAQAEVTGLWQHTAREGGAPLGTPLAVKLHHTGQHTETSINLLCDTAATKENEDHCQRSLLYPPHLLITTGFPQTTIPCCSANTVSVLAISQGKQPLSWSQLSSPTAAALGTPRGAGVCAPRAERNRDLAFTCVFPGSQLSLLLKNFGCGEGSCFRFQELNMQVIVWKRSCLGGSSVSWEPSSATAVSK